jgi:uncharacterized protein YukE
MAQLGMDVDAVEAAGRELQAKAQSIDAIVAQVNRSVASLESVWDGRNAQSFRASWPAIQKSVAAASQAVAGLGQSALNNASEQRQASGVSGAGSATGGASSGGSPAHNASPSLEDQFWAGTESFVSSTIPGTPWSVDQIGGLIPHVSDALDVRSIADSLHSGQVPWLTMLNVGAGELRSSPNPALYLTGAAISTWSTVGKDLSDAIALGPPTNDLNYIMSDPLGALDAAVQANVKAFPDLLGDLLP